MQTFSFDVFDTCVTRCYAEPTDIFEPLFAQLLATTDCPNHHISAAARTLTQQRMVAEQVARQEISQKKGERRKKPKPEKKEPEHKRDREEIEIREIYQLLAPQLAHYGLSANQAMSAEIELERSILSPISSTYQRIQQLRAQGHTIGFISDMYLPSAVIRQILETHGFLKPKDFLYVSSDAGYTKGSGKLFRHACQQLAISPSQLHHTGDNFYADVRAADKAGLRWTYFKQGQPNRYESADRIEPRFNQFDITWSTSYLVGLSRAIRLQHDQGDPPSRQQAMLSANILAPLLAGYLFSIIQIALQANIQQLYCTDALGEKLSAIATDIINQHLNHRKLQFLPYQSPYQSQTASPSNQTNANQTSTTQTDPSQQPNLQRSHLQQPKHNTSYSIGTILSSPTANLSEANPTQQSLCFSLLPTDQPATLQSVASPYLHHIYLSPPTSLQNASPKFLRKSSSEFAPLVIHCAVLEALLRSLTKPQTESYWQAITQYISHLATHYFSKITPNQQSRQSYSTPNLKPNLQTDPHLIQPLNRLQRYAISNLIQFLSNPTTDDANALLKLTSGSSDPINRWIKASLRLSPWPTKYLSNALIELGRRLYQYILTQRPLWFYKPIMRLHAWRSHHHK